MQLQIVGIRKDNSAFVTRIELHVIVDDVHHVMHASVLFVALLIRENLVALFALQNRRFDAAGDIMFGLWSARCRCRCRFRIGFAWFLWLSLGLLLFVNWLLTCDAVVFCAIVIDVFVVFRLCFILLGIFLFAHETSFPNRSGRLPFDILFIIA